MGRTNPTYRDALRRLESEWEPMRRALRREYQAEFDRLFDRGRAFADAAGYANPRDPGRALLLSVALAHEAELRRLREQLEELEEDERSESPALDPEPGLDSDPEGADR